jgi:hypothetical protein
VRLLISILLIGVLLASCSDSKANITAADVNQALREEGFSVAVVSRAEAASLRQVFAQDFGPVDDVVATYSASSPFRPSAGVDVGDLVVAGLIYRHASDATCSRSNVIGVCLHKRNIVIVVRNDQAPAARRALEELN